MQVEWKRETDGTQSWFAEVGQVCLRVDPSHIQPLWEVVIPNMESAGPMPEPDELPAFWKNGQAPDVGAAQRAAEAEVGPMLQRLVDWIGSDHLGIDAASARILKLNVENKALKESMQEQARRLSESAAEYRRKWMEALEERNDLVTTPRLLTMLRELEWSHHHASRRFCPQCGGDRAGGHMDGCELSLLIEHAGAAVGVELSKLHPEVGDLFVLRMTGGHKPPMGAIVSLTNAMANAYQRAGIPEDTRPDVLILGPAATLESMSDSQLSAMGFQRISAEVNPMLTDMMEGAARRAAAEQEDDLDA